MNKRTHSNTFDVKFLTKKFRQLLDEIPDNSIKIISLDDIAMDSPSEGTKCQIYGWSLTTKVS